MDLIYLKDAPLFCFIIQNETYFDFAHFDTNYGFNIKGNNIHPKYVNMIAEYQNDFTKGNWKDYIFDYPKIFSTQERFFNYDTLEE